DNLRSELGRLADDVEHARADAPTRLPVDRSISIPGFGTVVTGRLCSASFAAGARLRLEPSGRDVRVRSVQVHDCDVEQADAGQRVAVSLPGVERGDVGRCETLVAPGAYPRSFRLDVVLHELVPIAENARVHVHHGTADLTARVVRVGDRFAQLRLDRPVVAAPGATPLPRGAARRR